MVFTSTATAFRPSGPAVKSQSLLRECRVSNGFAGQWRDTSYLQQHAGHERCGWTVKPCISAIRTVGNILMHRSTEPTLAVYGPHASEG